MQEALAQREPELLWYRRFLPLAATTIAVVVFLTVSLSVSPAATTVMWPVAIAAVAGAVAMPVLLSGSLFAAGFTATGIKAGSIAASWMTVSAPAAGGVFAALQSAGMAGSGLAANTLCASVGAMLSTKALGWFTAMGAGTALVGTGTFATAAAGPLGLLLGLGALVVLGILALGPVNLLLSILALVVQLSLGILRLSFMLVVLIISGILRFLGMVARITLGILIGVFTLLFQLLVGVLVFPLRCLCQQTDGAEEL